MAAEDARGRALSGAWIAHVARRVLARDSFALLVEPAIADLQHDPGQTRADRLRAYAAVWIGLAAAFDAGLTKRGRALRRDNALVSVAGVVLLHAAHSAWMLVLLLGLDGRVNLRRMAAGALAGASTPGLVAGTCAALALVMYVATACFWPREPVTRASIAGSRAE